MQRSFLFAAGLLLVLATCSATRSDAREFAFRSGDRVVFLGDSITAGHFFTRDLEVFTRLRYPGLKVVFVNSGVGGETALDAKARLDRDVFAWNPTVVMVNFGMNDAGFAPNDPQGAYETNMKTLLDALSNRPGVRLVIWLDTTPFDVEGTAADHSGRAREKRIREFVAFAEAEGKRRGIPVVRWHERMIAALDFYRKNGKPNKLIADRVHPGPAGHAFMTHELLKTLDANLATAGVKGRYRKGRLELEIAGAGSRVIAWDAVSPVAVDLKGALPPVALFRLFPEGDPVPESVASLGRFRLKIQGLPEGKYRVFVSANLLKTFDAAALEEGVDLLDGVGAEPAQKKGGKADRKNYSAAQGMLWLDAWYRLFDACQAKDRPRYLLRQDQMKLLPDFVAGYPERFAALMTQWFEDANRELDGLDDAIAAEPREIRIEPVR